VVEIVGVRARGHVWQVRVWWAETEREWWAIVAPLMPDWSRGIVGRGATREAALKELEQALERSKGE
jgi:predicted RNase H-like HicB family nuclease